ncbi:Acid phosphatase [Hondaea fermentalgiana]|uniref:Acid phosphatase n=1 Tax=Hondaea fermentalgiana TaxID=2315210 RepID=A0A2R5G462_9STRA|nr:Acid phosphatase [Hondaea fermentalgiana]|eukprot:GBG25816.1 Acid phosphatase [Hondaea fermentalgiana]
MANTYEPVGAHFAPRRGVKGAPCAAAFVGVAVVVALALFVGSGGNVETGTGLAEGAAGFANRIGKQLATVPYAAQLATVPCATQRGRNPYAIDASSLETLEFFAIGDWGLDTEYNKEDGPRDDWDVPLMQHIGQTLNARIEEGQGSFVLNLGDNFYQWGISDVEDVRWETTFENVFATRRVVPWYSMLGNHDYFANIGVDNKPTSAGIDAQVDRTFHSANKRWCMPDTNYTILHATAHVDVRIVVFDSQALVRISPNANSPAYDTRASPDIEDHLAWLERAVCAEGRKGRKTIVMTAAHHFFLSAGLYFDRARQDEAILRERVLPVLTRCGVSMHFHGHDHVTQVIRIDKSLLQVGVGSAGKKNGMILGTQDSLSKMYPEHQLQTYFLDQQAAFAQVQISKDSVSLRLINTSGDAWGPMVASHID